MGRVECIEELGFDAESFDDEVAQTHSAVFAQQRVKNATETPHSVEVDGTRVHLHQLVRESDEVVGMFDNPLSDFWWRIVVDIDTDDAEIELANVGFADRKTVTFEEFGSGRFTPQTATDGTPIWGY